MSKILSWHNGLSSADCNSAIECSVPFIVNGAEIGTSGPVGGRSFVVDTVAGADAGSGDSAGPFLTVAHALAQVQSGDTVFVSGDIREEVIAPLGVYGVRIVGNVNGRTRHDNGVRWREPASGATTGGALLTLREQGWEVHNILFVPKSDATAVRLRRAEDATWPDGSHAIIKGCKFIGASIATQTGIEDHGGCHHVLVSGCEFVTMQSGIKHTVGAGIASPLRWQVCGNTFMDETSHLVLPANQSIVKGNVFDEATTNVNTSGGTAGENFVLDNLFSDDTGDITQANGYIGHASDVWRNFAQTGTAWTVGVPS